MTFINNLFYLLSISVITSIQIGYKNKLENESLDKIKSENLLENTVDLGMGVSSEKKMYDNPNTNTQYQNERVIVNTNGVENPMIPVAAGIGGEVLIACAECRKTISGFINRCVDQESAGQQADTFRTYCESFRDKPNSNINPETCLLLNAKLASVTGEPGTEIFDPTKPPLECIKFRSNCNNFGGAPSCYSGYCEQVAECIDCPSALVDKNKNGDFEMEVCGNSGICRLGWKNANSKGGNGYCECKNGMKGLSCNEY